MGNNEINKSINIIWFKYSLIIFRKTHINIFFLFISSTNISRFYILQVHVPNQWHKCSIIWPIKAQISQLCWETYTNIAVGFPVISVGCKIPFLLRFQTNWLSNRVSLSPRCYLTGLWQGTNLCGIFIDEISTQSTTLPEIIQEQTDQITTVVIFVISAILTITLLFGIAVFIDCRQE